MPANFFVRIQGRTLGPFDTNQLRSLRDRGQLKQFHEISADQNTWYPASNFPELFPSGPPSGRGENLSDTATEPLPRPGTIAAPPPPRREEHPEPDYPRSPSPRGRGSRGGRGGFPWLPVLGGCFILGGIITAVIFMAKGKSSNDDRATPKAETNTVTSFDEEKFKKAIGMVVCGLEVTEADGTRFEKLLSTGSSFVVSENGYLITNKHVIEEVEKRSRSPILERLKREKDIIIVPKVWVFFERTKMLAKIVYVSDDFDLAILKVDLPENERLNVFRLAKQTDPKRSTKVHALGYPGAASTELSDEELIKKIGQSSKSKLLTRVEQYFKERDFSFSSTDGSISRVVKEEGGRMWVQHNASIIHGSSGGPLITEDGTVIGINTRVSPTILGDSVSIAPGIYWALSLPQLKREIDRVIKDAQWQ